ncbi:MAG: alpha/beta hydrolase [Methylibium sp.]|uniref:alpha/beta hydrolase n=1 Tax=Methylibium sp. TaxID=2067992 RepID=UPI0017D9FA60|nr:alpha/beta hydrolase [Methylibium sp.]MBA3597121.1 alpha/beta hydrolase [Methylibium sp.]
MSTVPFNRFAAPTNEQIPLDAARSLPARIYGQRSRTAAPSNSASGRPLVLHFHAGAFVSGGLDSGELVAGLLAEAGAVVISIDYPLAPKQPFPAAVEAGHAALEWAHRQRGRLAGPAANLWVAGEEAGGNLAAAVAAMARDQQQPQLAGQILLSPMLDTCVATASLRKAQAGPVGCRWADGWHDYLAGPDDAIHPYAAPGRALRLAGLPPTLLITAEDDPMRDETHAYAERLREAGVIVEQALLPAPTGWPCAFMQTPQAEPVWAAALRDRLRRFLSADQARSGGDPPTAA